MILLLRTQRRNTTQVSMFIIILVSCILMNSCYYLVPVYESKNNKSNYLIDSNKVYVSYYLHPNPKVIKFSLSTMTTNENTLIFFDSVKVKVTIPLRDSVKTNSAENRTDYVEQYTFPLVSRDTIKNAFKYLHFHKDFEQYFLDKKDSYAQNIEIEIEAWIVVNDIRYYKIQRDSFYLTNKKRYYYSLH